MADRASRSAKAKRVGRKIGWCRADLKSRGCERCGYNQHSFALRYVDAPGGTYPLTLAYDDKGWGGIRRRAAGCRVLCFNCYEIERYELRSVKRQYMMEEIGS